MQRLDSYGKLWGLVLGPWGEGSKDLHALVTVVGNSMVAAKARARGLEGGEGVLGQVIGQLRRRLYVCSPGWDSLGQEPEQQLTGGGMP